LVVGRFFYSRKLATGNLGLLQQYQTIADVQVVFENFWAGTRQASTDFL
jgi:hypothetical protein